MTSALKKVNKAAASLGSWVRRPSTQPARFVNESRVLIVLPDDLCDAVREDVLAKKGWVQQGDDKMNPGGFSSKRFQLNVPKPHPTEKMSAILLNL